VYNRNHSYANRMGVESHGSGITPLSAESPLRRCGRANLWRQDYPFDGITPMSAESLFGSEMTPVAVESRLWRNHPSGEITLQEWNTPMVAESPLRRNQPLRRSHPSRVEYPNGGGITPSAESPLCRRNDPSAVESPLRRRNHHSKWIHLPVGGPGGTGSGRAPRVAVGTADVKNWRGATTTLLFVKYMYGTSFKFCNGKGNYSTFSRNGNHQKHGTMKTTSSTTQEFCHV